MRNITLNKQSKEHAPFQRIPAPEPEIVQAGNEQSISISEQEQQQRQIKQIMREVRVQKESQLYKKPSQSTLLQLKTSLVPKQRANRHREKMTNPVGPISRTGVNTRLGSLEAKPATHRLQSMGFNDPLLNMLTQIHSNVKESNQDGRREPRSTLYGFK